MPRACPRFRRADTRKHEVLAVELRRRFRRALRLSATLRTGSACRSMPSPRTSSSRRESQRQRAHAEVGGGFVKTAAFEQFRQQANDLRIEVVAGDNLAHLFGGNENDKGQTTRSSTR